MIHVAARAVVIHDTQIWVVSALQCEQHEVDPVSEDCVGAVSSLADLLKRFDNLVDVDLRRSHALSAQRGSQNLDCQLSPHWVLYSLLGLVSAENIRFDVSSSD